jgi:molybdenum cofactor cytidylyltransferase
LKEAGCFRVACVVLAAGAATRMGRLKQLMPYRDRVLVQHTVEQAVQAGFEPILVVVGAQAEAVQAALAAEPVEIVRNSDWQSGMGSSLSIAARKLQESGNDVAALAVLLSDQPLVSASHLRAMRKDLYSSNVSAIAAEYDGALGVPAIFKRSLLPRLAALEPAAGARHLLRDSGISVIPFPLPEAALDVDTPEDFAALVERAV